VPGVAAGTGVYTFTIPKDQFQIFEAAIFDGHGEQGFKSPSEDITGTIDLGAHTFQLHAVFATSIHFKEGCSFLGCVIDETDAGAMTADIGGTLLFPDVDHDGVPDDVDNCKFTANPDQTPVPTPVVTPPAPVTLTSCVDHNIGIASAVDVCDRTAVSISNNAPAAFHAGLNVVTWTGIDGKGRTGTAGQNVTVVDTTPPTVACSALAPPLGNSFVVTGDDICGAPTIRLGAHVLANGEQIMINETGGPGVRLIGEVGPDHVRHFHVGKGQAVITATDTSGNISTSVCR
jgi:thrombospondin type 3 repeat protein